MSHSFLTQCSSGLSRVLFALAVVGILGACATPQPYDYTAFKQARPASMLVLPPANDSPEAMATYGVLSQVTLPLAEAGYYVIPVSLMDETFKQNGIMDAAQTHELPAQKLREIFGADAAVYIRIKQYGTRYQVIASETLVEVEGRMVDLRSGQLLWEGKARASSAENRNNNQGGLVGMLVSALVNQIMETATDASFQYAGLASQRLLGAGTYNGVLPGPRSPLYEKR